MNKRIGFGIAVWAAGWIASSVAAQPAPNIIFLLADDQQWDTLGCNGNSIIQTPQIDTLARDGVNFSNAFVTTPICVVSRASILTGQYMRTHGIRDFNKPFTPEQMAKTYPAVLRKNGYFTGFTGKWGVGAEHFNYDLYKDEFDFWRGQPDQDVYWKDGKEGTHQNVRMSDDADDFLKQAKESGKPFCLSISFKAPHGPWDQCEPEIFNSIDQKQMPVPSTFTKEAWDAQPDFIQRSIGAHEAGVARDFKFNKGTNDHHQRLMAQYYALIQGLDASVGRIRESLKKYGFDENTVLIYTSDNGYQVHEKGLIGKWLMYEECLRVPMIVYDPRLPAANRGQVREETVLNVDVATTILSLAGASVPEQMQGADLTPLLLGETPEWRQDLFAEHTYSESGNRTIPKSVCIRDGKWKYVRYISETPAYEQLFDLEKDPDELNNLALSPERRETLERLRARCDVQRAELTDNYPDYQEYPEEYLVLQTGTAKANNPVQFANVESLGQSFKAATGYLTCCELMMPTWGRGEGPCDVTAELLQNEGVLKTLTIAKEDIENTRVQRLMFETPVKKGQELYLRLTPTGPVPGASMAWWAYDKPTYSGGTAYINDQPQNYSHEMTMVFRQEPGEEIIDVAPPPRTAREPAAGVTENEWRTDADFQSVVNTAGTITHAVNFRLGDTKTVDLLGIKFTEHPQRMLGNWDGFKEVQYPGPGAYRVWNAAAVLSPANGSRIEGKAAPIADSMIWNKEPEKTTWLDIGSLTPGATYRLYIFTRGWEVPVSKGCRIQNLKVSGAAGIPAGCTVNPNTFGQGVGNIIVINYTVQEARNMVRVAFEPASTGGMHLYGFINELVEGR